MSRYEPIHIESGPGRGQTGWYVRDLSVPACVVTIGGPHALRITVVRAIGLLERRDSLLAGKLAAASGDHGLATKIFAALGICYLHEPELN